jgi:Flp pilus assembly protein TadG
MVELTLALMAFLALLFGILEFSRALYVYHTVSNAARIGARWAMVRGSRCAAPLDNCNAAAPDVQTYVRSQIFGGMDPAQLTVDAAWPGGIRTCDASGPNNAPGCLVTVTATYQFGYALPWIAPQGFRLSSTSQTIITN